MVTKKGTINAITTSKYTNFKCKTIPLQWFYDIGVNEEDRAVNISICDNLIQIKKADIRVFKNLSKIDKILQVKKYEDIYGDRYDIRQDMIKSASDYFNVSTRTIYRLINESINDLNLEEVKLMPKQVSNQSTLNVVFTTVQGKWVVPVLSLSNEFACMLIEGKKFEELHIHKINDLIKSNHSFSILEEFKGDSIILRKY